MNRNDLPEKQLPEGGDLPCNPVDSPSPSNAQPETPERDTPLQNPASSVASLPASKIRMRMTCVQMPWQNTPKRRISKGKLSLKVILLLVGILGTGIFAYAVYWAMEDIFRCFGITKGLIGIFELPESLIYLVLAVICLIFTIIGLCISPYKKD